MKYWVWLFSTPIMARVYQVGEFSQDVPPDTTGTSPTGTIPEIIESHFTAYQPAYLGPDDEERLFCWLRTTGTTGFQTGY